MNHVATIVTNGRGQAVRLPAAFRFENKEVFIRQDPETGDVILSRKPATWDGFFELFGGWIYRPISFARRSGAKEIRTGIRSRAGLSDPLHA